MVFFTKRELELQRVAEARRQKEDKLRGKRRAAGITDDQLDAETRAFLDGKLKGPAKAGSQAKAKKTKHPKAAPVASAAGKARKRIRIGKRISLADKIEQHRRTAEEERLSAQLFKQWETTAQQLANRAWSDGSQLDGLSCEIMARARALIVVAEERNLPRIASALAGINRICSIGSNDVIACFLAEWHGADGQWRAKAGNPREAVMLALLAAHLASKALSRIQQGESPVSVMMLLVRAVEAVTRAELSHDLVAANCGFYALADAAMAAGRDEGKKALSYKAQEAKADKWRPLKEYALSLAEAGKYPSFRQAALAIASQVIAKGKEMDIHLKEQQAETTLTGWLKGMGFTPSTGKRGTSSGKRGTSTE